MTQLTAIFCIAVCAASIIAIILSIIYYVNSDVYKHPEEYKTKGATGERLAYLRLVDYGVPENQIVRNVYIPTKYGTTEIDIIVVSKKGVLVFECKNYHGTIYGDGKYDKWIQYLGKKKSYFYSPIKQNRNHVKQIKEHFNGLPGLPVIPFFVATTNAEWKLKNINPEDHVLHFGSFMDVYNSLPDSKCMARWHKYILDDLKKYERPDENIRQKHIDQVSCIKK